MDTHSKSTFNKIEDVIKEEADDFIDDVKEELIEAKDNLVSEIKSTLLGLGNSIFGDVNLFFSIIKTVTKWFTKPLSLNVRDVEKENQERLSEGKKIRYFTDFSLLKSIFMLSLTFLVIEETATNASSDHWMDQIIFFLFFVVLYFVFIGIMWLWKLVSGLNTGDTRVFMAFIGYQFATIYIVSFLVNGPLRINMSGDESFNIFMLVYFFQLIHSLYFLSKLTAHYSLKGIRRKLSLVVGAVILIVFLFIPSAVTEVFLLEGAG